MPATKPGMRPKRGDTVVIVENGKPFDMTVTKSGTKYFYVGEDWRFLKFAIGGPEGQTKEGWSDRPTRVYSSMAAYQESVERQNMLQRMSDMTRNCGQYGEIKNRCPTANIRKALELLGATECSD
jgi:hypothetical protein